MTIQAYTTDPSALLKKMITAVNKGVALTWTYDVKNGFLHSPEQWGGVAYFKVGAKEKFVEFNLEAGPNINRKKGVNIYGYFHGRFIEMLMTNFIDDCSAIRIVDTRSKKIKSAKVKPNV